MPTLSALSRSGGRLEGRGRGSTVMALWAVLAGALLLAGFSVFAFITASGTAWAENAPAVPPAIVAKPPASANHPEVVPRVLAGIVTSARLPLTASLVVPGVTASQGGALAGGAIKASAPMVALIPNSWAVTMPSALAHANLSLSALRSPGIAATSGRPVGAAALSAAPTSSPAVSPALQSAPQAAISAAPVAVNQCNGTDNVGGQAVACDVTVTNNLDRATGLTSSSVTVKECHGAANAALPCTTSTTPSNQLTTSVNQCNGSGGGGGGTVTCNVHVVNNITGVAPLTPATVNQCNGSGTGGGTQPTISCSPIGNTTNATIDQCNNSGNGGGATIRVQCAVTPSTETSALPVTINQCNGSGSGGGGTVTCTTSVVNNIIPASPVVTPPVVTPVVTPPVVTPPVQTPPVVTPPVVTPPVVTPPVQTPPVQTPPVVTPVVTPVTPVVTPVTPVVTPPVVTPVVTPPVVTPPVVRAVAPLSSPPVAIHALVMPNTVNPRLVGIPATTATASSGGRKPGSRPVGDSFSTQGRLGCYRVTVDLHGAAGLDPDPARRAPRPCLKAPREA